MLIRFDECAEVAVAEDDLAMRALVRAADGAGVSVTHVRLTGEHRPLRTLRSARVYVVLEGAARFTIGDAEPVRAGPGDVVVVPKGELYSLAGYLTYLVLNAPPYEDGDDLYEERP